MQKKNLKRLLAILSAFVASACGTVTITDQEWCGDMGEHGASCFYTISEESRDITKEQWDIDRFGQVCGTSAAYSEFVAALLKLCSDDNRCSWEVKKKIKDFRKNVKSIQREARRKSSR